jgi:hypothetical protein
MSCGVKRRRKINLTIIAASRGLLKTRFGGVRVPTSVGFFGTQERPD